MPTFTIQLTDDHIEALEAYAKLPQHIDWEYDPVVKNNMPKRRFADARAVIDECVAMQVKAAMETCPPAATKALIDQRAAIDAQIAAKGKPTVEMK